MSDSKSQENPPEKKTCQERVETFFNDVFGAWGAFVARNPCKVFWGGFLVVIGLASGMHLMQFYDDEQVIWTPAGNPSLKAKDKSEELFPMRGGFVGIMVESKSGESILTKEHFKEIQKLEDKILQTEAFVMKDDKNTSIKFQDICIKVADKCFTGKSPLTFALNRKGEVDVDQFKKDEDLLKAIQKGQGGFYQGDGSIIEIEPMFGGMEPENIDQDSKSGANDLKSAKLAVLSIPFEGLDFTKDELQKFEVKAEEAGLEFAKGSSLLNVYMYTLGGLQDSFTSDIEGDLTMVQLSMNLVAVYCIFFMGSCSPIHFRSAAAGITLLCVGLSYASSFGLAQYLGGKMAGIHGVLPFLLIGIGVDDMFVISSAIDQTDPTHSTVERMRKGMMHAGSSITITSFTNAMAFFFGCSSSLDALASFCFFSGLGVLMLYFTSITIFTAFMVWDIQRQVKRKGDCCGACCCKEDSLLCCKGSCLSARQKAYPFQGNQDDVPPAEDQYINGTQKFLHQTFSKATTSTFGTITILLVWFLYLAFSIYGCMNLEVDFKTTYFISETSPIRTYVDKSDEYFKAGDMISFYVETNGLEISEEANQKKLVDFMDKLETCEGCSKNRIQEDSLSSWFVNFQSFAKSLTKARPKRSNGMNPCYKAWDSKKEIVAETKFYKCLDWYLQTQGQQDKSKIKFDENDDTKITAFKMEARSIYVKSAAKEGVQLLSDINEITNTYGLADTYSFSQRYLDYETYVVFDQEATLNVGLALGAVFLILVIFTANLTVTLLVLLQVALVDVFLFSLLYFWGVTLNSVTIVNITVAIGLSVDYSAHIGHAFLTIDPPTEHLDGSPTSKREQRIFKARGAIGQMGPSVFHGAFSTFLAIVVLAPSNSYIFQNFFKMWFGIIIYGVANGFIFLPVLLSLCGPLNKVQHPKGHGTRDTQVMSDTEKEIELQKQKKADSMVLEEL